MDLAPPLLASPPWLRWDGIGVEVEIRNLKTNKQTIQEVSESKCVYRNEVAHAAGERTQVLQDVASDPTLPRT
ncbi:hypothetical protein E2562_036311 [Oryza meyeriana var. granulata]|uniref:Uncharacterized protein n=1 Tax=Oryza meyeriana var. granulata TaxID=110450 RepID=A0A6G1FFY1_9ORYZ|nr:hypothetical protein E2562_036311 [Oryza meyeriana var. granulata]